MATMSKFGQNIKFYNSWCTDKRSIIVKKVGAAGYTDYLHCLFKMHMMPTNTNFKASVKDQREKWMVRELKKGYKYNDLI
eukprot:9386083-Ditylum_brightwellii.AAC.1